MNGSVIVKAVPSRPSVAKFAPRAAAPTGPAMWMNGIVMAARRRSATLCMVFVHSLTQAVPARSRRCAAAASGSAASSQRPSRCASAIGAKSTLSITIAAECSGPRRSCTPWLIAR